MVYDDLVNSTNDKPRLVDMATEAVKFLKAKAGTEGFFIMIEVRA
jgi:alkaline phosphatase